MAHRFRLRRNTYHIKTKIKEKSFERDVKYNTYICTYPFQDTPLSGSVVDKNPPFFSFYILI